MELQIVESLPLKFKVESQTVQGLRSVFPVRGIENAVEVAQRMQSLYANVVVYQVNQRIYG